MSLVALATGGGGANAGTNYLIASYMQNDWEHSAELVCGLLVAFVIMDEIQFPGNKPSVLVHCGRPTRSPFLKRGGANVFDSFTVTVNGLSASPHVTALLFFLSLETWPAQKMRKFPLRRHSSFY